MITPLSTEQIKQKFGLEFTNCDKLSQTGGLRLVLDLLTRAKLRRRLTEIAGDGSGQALLQVLVGILAGARTMRGVAQISQDRAIKAYLGKPLSETQITRNLKKLTPPQIQSLHELTMSLGFLDLALGSYKGIRQYLDIDATPIEMSGKQEGVENGYIDKDKIGPCYQYLLFKSDQLETPLWATLRGGAAHSQNGFIGHLDMFLPMFNLAWDLAIRADSGFYSEEAIERFHANKIYFFIRAPMTAGQQAIAGSDQIEWFSQEGVPDTSDVQWSMYDTNTKGRCPFRLVFRREKLREKQNPLFDEYKTLCVATNDLEKEPWEVFEVYNKRARIEKTIEELKNDYALGKIVTQSFAVNDAITQMSTIAFQFISHFRRHCLDKSFQKYRLRTLRTLLLNTPARLISTGRRQWLRVHNRFVTKNVYGRICARLEALQSLWVIDIREAPS